MSSNLDRYKKDLDSLVAKGEKLYLAMQWECSPEQVMKALTERVAMLTGRGSSGRFSAKRAAQPGKRLFDVRGDGRGDTAATTSLLTVSVPEQPK